MNKEQQKAIEKKKAKQIGAKLDELRKSRGLSQSDLAELFCISFQQMQKMIKGVNRISAERLHILSIKLNVPLDYFFEGVVTKNCNEIKDSENIAMVGLYSSLEDKEVRKNVRNLLKNLNNNNKK